MGLGYAFQCLESEIAVVDKMDCGLPITVRGRNGVVYRRLDTPKTPEEVLARTEPVYVGIQDGHSDEKVETWQVPDSAFNVLFPELVGPLAAKKYADAMRRH